VSKAVAVLSGKGLDVGAYANGFTRISEAFLQPDATVSSLEKRSDLDPEAYAEFAEDWIRTGACIVGGCCEVGPEHIRLLARRFKKTSRESHSKK
jgi:homocysteine S-methyltransferase